MQILFVTPYPPSRIRVRAYGMICSLAREHSVTILTQVMSQQEIRDKEALEQQGYRVVAVHTSKPRALGQCGVALLKMEPLQVAYARSRGLLHAARALCAQFHFDIIHVEHLRGIASMAPLAQQYPLVWDAVDCITRLWEQTAVAGPSLAVRKMAQLEQKRTARFEGKLLQDLEHVIAISEEDGEALVNLACQSGRELSERVLREKMTIVPNGIDLDYFCVQKESSYQEYNLVFSGKMSYHANVAAVQYLYREIMPLIWRVQPAATLTVVGSRPPSSIQRLAMDSRVTVTGFVEDIRPYIRRAHVVVCPTVYSVGQQNKALEAMALGIPVVLSAQSAMSLQACVGEDLLTARNAHDFADSVLRLFGDKNLRERLGHNGRQYVEYAHNWPMIVERLLALYQSVAADWRNGRVKMEYTLATASEE